MDDDGSLSLPTTKQNNSSDIFTLAKLMLLLMRTKPRLVKLMLLPVRMKLSLLRMKPRLAKLMLCS